MLPYINARRSRSIFSRETVPLLIPVISVAFRYLSGKLGASPDERKFGELPTSDLPCEPRLIPDKSSLCLAFSYPTP